MPKRTLGTAVLTGALLAAGLAGLAISWAAWPRTSATSPLMALLALTWSSTCIVTSVLTWRRSRYAAEGFVAVIGALLLPARFIVPGGELVLPALLVLAFVAFVGHRYVRRSRAAG